MKQEQKHKPEPHGIGPLGTRPLIWRGWGSVNMNCMDVKCTRHYPYYWASTRMGKHVFLVVSIKCLQCPKISTISMNIHKFLGCFLEMSRKNKKRRGRFFFWERHAIATENPTISKSYRGKWQFKHKRKWQLTLVRPPPIQLFSSPLTHTISSSLWSSRLKRPRSEFGH